VGERVIWILTGANQPLRHGPGVPLLGRFANSATRLLWAIVMRHPQPVRSRVLLVESNAIIGLDLAEDLEACGYQVSGPFAAAIALEYLQGSTPDVAVLDADLRTGVSVDLTRALCARGVPMLIFSCYDQKHALPEFRGLPWLSMPASLETLHAALELLVPRKGGIVLSGNVSTRRPHGERVQASRSSSFNAERGRRLANGAER
jgi:DNA-binding response OmpR family regulator